MSTEWPRRPFHELPPPAGGVPAVRRAARRRRARAAGLASATAVALVVTGAALAAPTRPGRQDSLQVVDPPTGAATSPTPSAPAPAPAGSPTGSPSPSPAATDRPSPSPTPSATAPDGGRPAPSYRTPDLVRTYVDRTPSGGLTLCPEAHGRGTSLHVDWCQTATASATTRGHDLVAEVCRDATSDGTLTLASAQEVELTVEDAKGRAVWTWSAGHPDPADPHVLAVQRGHCWDWTARWTDVDADGRPLPSGSYVLVVVSRARELQGAAPGTTSFVL